MFNDDQPAPASDDDKKDDPIAQGGAENTDPEADPPTAEDLSKPAAGPGVSQPK